MRYTFDNINTQQYFNLLKIGESKKPEDVIWALTGKTREELTLNDIESFQVGSLEPHLEISESKLFIANGVLYGLQDLDNMSFGLFQDIMSLGKDIKETLPTMMSYMYRPVTKISFWNLTKLRIIGMVGNKIRGARMAKWLNKKLYNIKYDIELYNPLKCEDRIDEVCLAKSYTGHFLVTFFLILSQELQKHSLNSLNQNLQMMKKELKKLTIQ